MSEAAIYHGDSLAAMREMAEGSFDAVVTDPPYEIGGDVVRTARGVVESLPEWDRYSTEWVPEVARVLRVGGSVIAFTDGRRVDRLWSAYESAGLRPRNLFYWVKHATPPNPRRSFQSAVEVAVWAAKGVATWNGGALTPNVWFGNIVKADRIHPTQKPVDLAEHLIRLVTPEGGRVLDPFCGSGTTVIAAARLGFDAVGIERDAGYFDLARDRLKAFQERAGLFADSLLAVSHTQGE